MAKWDDVIEPSYIDREAFLYMGIGSWTPAREYKSPGDLDSGVGCCNLCGGDSGVVRVIPPQSHRVCARCGRSGFDQHSAGLTSARGEPIECSDDPNYIERDGVKVPKKFGQLLSAGSLALILVAFDRSADAANTPDVILDPAVQSRELRKLESEGIAALTDPFWSYVMERHSVNPARFDRYHPIVGPILERLEREASHPAGSPATPPGNTAPVVPTSPPVVTPPVTTPPVTVPPVVTPPVLPSVIPSPFYPPGVVPSPSSGFMALAAAGICAVWARFRGKINA